MAFEYVINVTSVLNVLKDCNTTTSGYDLSTGLSARINSDNIFATDPEKFNPRSDRLPAVYVRINNKTEEFAGIGNTGISGAKKEAIVEYDIIGIIGSYGIYGEYADILSDIYKLGRNIEEAFRNNVTLSNTAMWCNTPNTEFLNDLSFGDSFAKACVVKLEGHYQFK